MITAFAAALRIVGRQGSGNLRQVLQPHGDMGPIQVARSTSSHVSAERHCPRGAAHL
jgi:hypothetical protein